MASIILTVFVPSALAIINAADSCDSDTAADLKTSSRLLKHSRTLTFFDKFRTENLHSITGNSYDHTTKK
jgi:hypothetical protein